MRRALAVVLILRVSSAAFGAPKFPALTDRVVDDAHILSSSTVQQLDQMLADYERGTTNQVVTITKPDVTMTNTTNPGTDLTLVLNGYGPDNVTLPNSGSSGINFKLGGASSIPANVKDGVYTGDLNVTVNY